MAALKKAKEAAEKERKAKEDLKKWRKEHATGGGFKLPPREF